MAREEMRWIPIVACLLAFLVFGHPVHAQDVPTYAIILIDETAQEINEASKEPIFKKSWEWAYDVLDLLADETRSETWVQIIKFNRAAINAPFLFSDWKLLEGNINEIKGVIPTPVDWKLRPRPSITRLYDYSVKKALCKAWRKFGSVKKNAEKIALLISDGGFEFRILPIEWPWCEWKNTSTILSWYKKAANWRWSWDPARGKEIFQFQETAGIPIHTFHYIGPANPEKASSLAHISIETGGHLIRRTDCINGRIFHTLEKLLHELASKMGFDISFEPSNVDGQRRVRIEIQAHCGDKPIRECIEKEAKCEDDIRLQLGVRIFLDDELIREAVWDPDEQVSSFSVKIPCEADHTLTVRPFGKVTKRHKEGKFSDSSSRKFLAGADNIEVGWFKTKDAFGLGLEYMGACGVVPPAEKRGSVRIDYPKAHFNLLDEERNPIKGSEVSFDEVKRTLYLRARSDLEPEQDRGYYEGLISVLPGSPKLQIRGEPKFDHSYRLAVVRIHPDKFIFPNLCWPPKQIHNDSFTAHFPAVTLEGIPKDWDWNVFKQVNNWVFPGPGGVTVGVINPRGNPKGQIFDLKLTLDSCSALRTISSELNNRAEDWRLSFQDPSSSEEWLTVFKSSEIPVDLSYKKKWVRITEVKDCSKGSCGVTDFSEGVLHKGDKAFIVSLEHSPDLAEEEKCVKVGFDSRDLELFDGKGEANKSGIICGEQFTLRVHQDTTSGHKTEELSLFPDPSTDKVYLYCSADASQLAEECRYAQDRKRYEFDVPFPLIVQNKEFICPSILISKEDRPNACNLELQFGPGSDAIKWGKLMLQVSELDSKLKELGITVGVQEVSPAEILPPFNGRKTLQLVFNVEIREPPSSIDWEKLPNKLKGEVGFSFSDGGAGRVVELNKSTVPLVVPIRLLAIEILNVNDVNELLNCDINRTSTGELVCKFSLTLQSRDRPSWGHLNIQITDGLGSDPAYINPPFAGNKKVSVVLEGNIVPPRNVKVRMQRDDKEISTPQEIVKIPPHSKLLDLSFQSMPPVPEGSEKINALEGKVRIMYDPEGGPPVELNGSIYPVTIPIEATIHQPKASCEVRITCTSDTLRCEQEENALYLAPSSNSEKGGNGLISLSDKNAISVFASDDISRGVHRLDLRLESAKEEECSLIGDRDVQFRLRVRSPIVAGVEYHSRWIALVLFALPALALLITWIIYRNSGYDGFPEYIDDLRWRWGKWIYVVPPISLGLAFLTSVAWFLAAFVLV